MSCSPSGPSVRCLSQNRPELVYRKFPSGICLTSMEVSVVVEANFEAIATLSQPHPLAHGACRTAELHTWRCNNRLYIVPPSSKRTVYSLHDVCKIINFLNEALPTFKTLLHCAFLINNWVICWNSARLMHASVCKENYQAAFGSSSLLHIGVAFCFLWS